MEARVEGIRGELEADRAAAAEYLRGIGMRRGDVDALVYAFKLSSAPIVYDSGMAFPAGTDGERIIVGRKYFELKERFGFRAAVFLLAHEVGHILHAHPARAAAADDAYLFNVVSDLVVNSFLDRMIGIPGGLKRVFVTMESALDFLVRGGYISGGDAERVRGVLEDVLDGRVTVEAVYNALRRLCPEGLRRLFSKSSFYGRDLVRGRPSTPGRSGGGGGLDVEELEGRLRRVWEAVARALEEVEAERARAKALLHGVGRTPDSIVERAFYRELEPLRVWVPDVLDAVVSRVVLDYRYNFARPDRGAYWLPSEEEEWRPRVRVLLDVSGSIGEGLLRLFLRWLLGLAGRYGVEVDVATFSYGVKERFTLQQWRDDIAVGRGLNTVWERSVADILSEATREQSPLLVVLSDFMIDIRPEAAAAMREYRRRGGRVLCVAPPNHGGTGFCDYVALLAGG